MIILAKLLPKFISAKLLKELNVEMLCLEKRTLSLIFFGVDTPVCTKWLNELRKQHVINELVYRKKLLENTIRKLA